MLETQFIKIDPEKIDNYAMRRAGEIIAAGGLVAFPTETVYGLELRLLIPALRRRYMPQRDGRQIIRCSRTLLRADRGACREYPGLCKEAYAVVYALEIAYAYIKKEVVYTG